MISFNFFNLTGYSKFDGNLNLDQFDSSLLLAKMCFISSIVIFVSTFIILLNTVVHGLGVNCRGDRRCKSEEFLHVMDRMIQNINLTNDEDIYDRDVFVACIGASSRHRGFFCAFTHGHTPDSGVTGAVLKEKISELKQHGCKTCGGVPFSGNDPNPMGMLLVDYSKNNDGCNEFGLCPPSTPAPRPILSSVNTLLPPAPHPILSSVNILLPPAPAPSILSSSSLPIPTTAPATPQFILPSADNEGWRGPNTGPVPDMGFGPGVAGHGIVSTGPSTGSGPEEIPPLATASLIPSSIPLRNL